MNPANKGMMIAAAAASLFISGNVRAHASEKTGGEMVHCAGINACKGQGACKGSADACKGASGCKSSNSCKGQNSCKGKGWVEKSSAEECTKLGGKVLASKSE